MALCLVGVAGYAADLNLETITVEAAGRQSQKLSDITANVEVITHEEIEQSHALTVGELLASVPGLSITSN